MLKSIEIDQIISISGRQKKATITKNFHQWQLAYQSQIDQFIQFPHRKQKTDYYSYCYWKTDKVEQITRLQYTQLHIKTYKTSLSWSLFVWFFHIRNGQLILDLFSLMCCVPWLRGYVVKLLRWSYYWHWVFNPVGATDFGLITG